MNMMNNHNGVSYPLERGDTLRSVMRQVYVWMGVGTLLTAAVAYVTVNSALINLIANPVILFGALIAELALVMGISFGFNRISALTATFLFLVYAALNGFTLSIVLMAFTTGSVVGAFVATGALFGAMSIIGYTTHVDLSKLGTFLMMALIGLLIAMVVNIFIASGPLDLIISVIGVLLFTALTAYDTQRIGRMAAQMDAQGEAGAKLSIFGALKLYLDLINLFLFMLRLIGRRR